LGGKIVFHIFLAEKKIYFWLKKSGKFPNIIFLGIKKLEKNPEIFKILDFVISELRHICPSQI